MKKSKTKKKKLILYISVAVIALLIIIAGLYFIIKAKQIRQGKVLDCGEGTAIYLDENLCWQKTAWPSRAKNWQDAKNYCETLTLTDKEDWRLPTKEELSSILKEDLIDVDIDQEVFKGTEPIHYWTSSEYKPGMHWYIHFEKGHEGFSQDFNSNYGVRCVRDIIFY